MARFKHVDLSPRPLPVDLDAQLVPGSFAHAVHQLVDVLDLSAFDAHYRNDRKGDESGQASIANAAKWWLSQMAVLGTLLERRLMQSESLVIQLLLWCLASQAALAQQSELLALPMQQATSKRQQTLSKQLQTQSGQRKKAWSTQGGIPQQAIATLVSASLRSASKQGSLNTIETSACSTSMRFLGAQNLVRRWMFLKKPRFASLAD